MANGDGTKTDARVLARLRALPSDHPTRIKARERSRAWNAANPRKAFDYDRTVRRARAAADPDHRLKARARGLRKYGLTVATWDALFSAQGHACAICRATETPDGRWHTDHDDSIGYTAVRGILCVRCNIGIGQLRARLLAAGVRDRLPEGETVKDLKESLSSARKADLTHVRKAFMVYTARPCELGTIKYVRSNFLRTAAPVEGGAPLAADFVRFRSYLRAAMAHIVEVLDAMEIHQATDPNLLDVEGMKRAAYAVDTDVTPGARVGASLLPHVAPACSSLMMAVTQAVNAGLLPADPGTPWREPAVLEIVTANLARRAEKLLDHVEAGGKLQLRTPSDVPVVQGSPRNASSAAALDAAVSGGIA